MVLAAHAPVRIDFAGAWTDVAFFADAFGGATLNAAINIHVTGSLKVSEEEPGDSFDLGREALVVNYGSTIPAGSGLGTSATLNVVWLTLARREPIRSDEDKMRIAELAYEIERTLGILGGKQDQYASAVGGINLFEFTAEGVKRHPVALSPAQRAELESLLVLCYTGKARLSSNIHRSVWGNFREGKEDTLTALFQLRRSAYEAKKALEAFDLPALAELVTQQRHYMRALDASTTNAQIEELFELAAPHIFGGKPCGAGGGGCLLFIARSPAAKVRLKEALSAHGLRHLDIAFDLEGLCMTVHGESR